MNKIQEIKTEYPTLDNHGIIPENNLEKIGTITFKNNMIEKDSNVLNLYTNDKITVSELLIIQLIKEYYE